MKIELKISCEIAGLALAVPFKGKAAIHDVPVSVLSDSYFASLLRHGSVKLVSVEEAELKALGEEAFKKLDQSVIDHVISYLETTEADFAPPEADALLSEEEIASLVAQEKADLEAKEEAEKLASAKAAELKAQQLEEAKAELLVLGAKKQLSNKDKKRVEELNKIVGA